LKAAPPLPAADIFRKCTRPIRIWSFDCAIRGR
jgi:hypothetical protein